MKKKVLKNYIYNLSYQLLILFLPFITTPYLARTLGAAGTGVYSFTISIVTYFILFGSLGLSLYGQREIAYNQDNIERKSKIFWELIILRLIFMLISSMVFFFMFVKSGEYAQYYRILLFQLFASCLDITWFYQGIEEFKKIVIRNFLLKIINIVLIFLLIKNSEDVSKYIFIYVLDTFIGNLILWFNIKKNLSKVKISELKIFSHLKQTVLLFIPQIAIQLYTVLDKTMIGIILKDMTEVGYYEQSQKLIKMLLTVVTSIGTVLLPRMAHFFANGNSDEIKKYMYLTFQFVFLLTFPLLFGLIAIASDFVPIFFGDGYDKVIVILRLMSPIILFIGMSSIIGNQYLLTTKKQKQYTFSVLCGAMINFLLNCVLIGRYFSYGATIATVLAEFSVTFIQLFFIRNELNIKRIINLSKNYFIASLIMLFVCIFIGYFMHNTYFSILFQVIVGGIVYIWILSFLQDDILLNIFKKLKNRKEIKNEI